MGESSIYIFGDICPRWRNDKLFDTQDPGAILHDIMDVISESDFNICNLEAPLTKQSIKLKKSGVNIKANECDAEVLNQINIGACSLSNNHILDYGISGLEDTIKSLERAGIEYFGAGTVEEAAKVYIVTLHGKRVGFLSYAEQEFNCAVDYGKGANLWDDLTSVFEINKSKKICDYLVVLYHGGIEHYKYPSPYLQKKCRAMVSAGADLVLCQHSHCIGALEKWEGKDILYGQGNSIFGYEKNNTEWNYGLLVKLRIYPEKMETSYIPIEAKEDGEYVLDEKRAKDIHDFLFTESVKVYDSEFILKEWERFCQSKKDAYFPMILAKGRIFNKMNRLLKGKLIRLFINKKTIRVMMNLIRCDAHLEVIKTILESEYNEEQCNRAAE